MNKISKSSLLAGKTIEFSNDDVRAEGYALHYPLRGIKELSYVGRAYKMGKRPHVEMLIRGKLVLEDGYDGSLFENYIVLEEETYILSSGEEDEEGYIFPEGSFDLDELCLLLVEGSLPMRVSKHGHQKKIEVGGITFVEEGEEEKSSPFDAIEID